MIGANHANHDLRFNILTVHQTFRPSDMKPLTYDNHLPPKHYLLINRSGSTSTPTHRHLPISANGPSLGLPRQLFRSASRISQTRYADPFPSDTLNWTQTINRAGKGIRHTHSLSRGRVGTANTYPSFRKVSPHRIVLPCDYRVWRVGYRSPKAV